MEDLYFMLTFKLVYKNFTLIFISISYLNIYTDQLYKKKFRYFNYVLYLPQLL